MTHSLVEFHHWLILLIFENNTLLNFFSLFFVKTNTTWSLFHSFIHSHNLFRKRQHLCNKSTHYILLVTVFILSIHPFNHCTTCNHPCTPANPDTDLDPGHWEALWYFQDFWLNRPNLYLKRAFMVYNVCLIFTWLFIVRVVASKTVLIFP